MLSPRSARPEDIDEIMAIVAHARAAIARFGIDQWQDGYPEREIIEADIAAGIGYVFEADGKLAGYMALAPSPEAVYEQIDGRWRTDDDYLTIHRLCLDDGARGKGDGISLIAWAEVQAMARRIPALRADTHRGNLPMRKLLESCCFSYCGTVTYPVTAGDPLRAAYEKRVTDS